MKINRAHLVWEVRDANTVSRGGGHCGQLETTIVEKRKSEPSKRPSSLWSCLAPRLPRLTRPEFSQYYNLIRVNRQLIR